MTITKDTDLSEILSSDSVIDEMSTFTGNIQGLINDRTSTLQTEMASGNGISETQLVDGEPLFYTKGTEVSSEYGNVSESATNLNKSICSAAIEKERDELRELRICLLKDNQEIQDRIAAYEAEYQEKVAEVKKINLKQGMYDGIAMAAAPWGGIYTPIGRRVFVLADLKEDYYGESGVIKLEEKKFNTNNEKIVSINYRMTQLKESYSNYSDADLDTRYHYKPRYQGGNDSDNTVDSGTTAGGTDTNTTGGADTNTDTNAETANPTDATEATNSGTDTSTDTTNSGVDADLLSKDIKI